MSTSSVPKLQFTPQGVIIPSDADLLAGAQEDMNYAFGGRLNPALNTPQGQMASSAAAIVADKDSEIAYVCNQVDPQYAEGRFQDAIGRIYFMTRKAATATVVACVVTGLAGTVIPAATLAQDTAGNTYALLAGVVIGAGGTAMSSWANLATGPIPCPEATLTQVYQAVPGWDAISNPADGVQGTNVESRADFEFRRKNSVALNGRGSCPSIQAAVFDLPNVVDCYVIDNPTGAIVLKGSTNYPLLPHSVYVAVVGGASADIAKAIWSKKDVGCDYNGNTAVTVVDDSNYDFPFPSYAVKYEIPADLPILFDVQIVSNPSLPSNIAALVQAAIIAQFNGSNGSQRARIGSLILATSYFGAIASVAPNLMLVSVSIGSDTPTHTSVQVGIDQFPTISAADITVTLV